jgi:hypothetical protein
MEQFLIKVGYSPTTIQKTRSQPKEFSLYVVNIVLSVVKLIPEEGSMTDKIKSFKFYIERTRADLTRELQSAKKRLFAQAGWAMRSMIPGEALCPWPCWRLGFHFANKIEPCPSSMESTLIPISWITNKAETPLCKWILPSLMKPMDSISIDDLKINHPDVTGFEAACSLVFQEQSIGLC